MSNNRVIVLEKIVGRISLKLDFYKREIENYETLEKTENREKWLSECKERVSKYSESYDVLNTILNHSSEYFRELYRDNKDISWNNENDIPIDVYKRGLSVAMDILNGKEDSHTRKTQKDEERLELLNKLLNFRN